MTVTLRSSALRNDFFDYTGCRLRDLVHSQLRRISFSLHEGLFADPFYADAR